MSNLSDHQSPEQTGSGAGRQTYTAGPEDAATRLDRFLAKVCAPISRTRLKALIEKGAVTIDGAPVKEPRHAVKEGDTISLMVPEPEPAAPIAQNIPLTILFEDDAVIVINKPSGLVVHPGAGHQEGTLVNALLAHCGETLSGIGGVKRPGIVHRLDKDTSGVMVVAKSDTAHRALSSQFEDHGRTGPLERSYRALVWGRPRKERETIDAPIGRTRQSAVKFAVVRDGKFAITHVDVLHTFYNSEALAVAAEVRCRLETGRTHQIRVHMAHMGHPVMGDPLYASGFKTKVAQLHATGQTAMEGLGRQALHAASLTFEHPVTGEIMAFEAPPPDDYQGLLGALSLRN